MEKYSINIANDFNAKLGGRFSSVSAFSGEDFYNTLLEPKFSQAIEANEQLHIYLDGASPYGSSFIGQSFGELGKKYGSDKVKANIVFHTDLYGWIVDIIKNDLWK